MTVVALCVVVSALAQRPTGGRIVVQGGRKVTVFLDTLSLDSTQRDSLRRADSLHRADTLKTALLPQDSLSKMAKADEKEKKERKKFSLTRDTISPGALVGLSIIPGMGQIYNGQWWKAPVFYGVMGGFTAAGFAFNNQSRLASLKWQNAINTGADQATIDGYRTKMMGHQTTATVMFAVAGATYLYQLADATFNYRGNTSHIRKATTLACLFPGAGFIYTRTYWRLPIYYGGFAVIGTVVDYNNRSYQRYKRAWELVVDGDPDTKDEFNGYYSADILKNAKDSYRRDRDFGIICLAAVYILSVVDTYVIATLKNWDISPDLSVTLTPTVFDERLGQNSMVPAGAGMALRVKF